MRNSNAALALDEDFDASDVERMVEGKTDFRQLQRMKEMSGDIRKQLMKSTDVVSEKDRQPLYERLTRATEEGNSEALRALQNQIVDLVKRSTEAKKQATEQYRKMKMTESEVRKRMDEFSNLSLSEKEKMLKEEIAQRAENYAKYEEKFIKYSEYFSQKSISEYLQGFKDLATLREQQRWLENFEKTELPERVKLMKKYKAFNKNRQKNFSHFIASSRHEKVEIIEDMENDLNNEYHDKIFNSSEAKFISSDSRYQAYMYFIKRERTIEERERMLKMLEDDLPREKEIFEKCEKLFKDLKGKVETNFSEIYQKKIKPKLKYKIDHESEPKGLKDLSYEERDILLKYLTENKKEFLREIEEDKKLEEQYKKKLDEAVEKHILRRSTADEFAKWFKEELIKDKSPKKDRCSKLIKNFDNEKEISERFKRLDEFEKTGKKLVENRGLPSAKFDQLLQKFYNASFDDRGLMLDDLYKKQRAWEEHQAELQEIEEDPTMAAIRKELENPEMKEQVYRLNLATALQKERNHEYEDAIKIYKAILVSKPHDEVAKRHLERLEKICGEEPENASEESQQLAAIDLEIDRAKQTDTMKETLTYANIAFQLGNLAKKSDDYNKNSHRHEAHLEGREDSKDMKAMNEAMLQQSEGKVGLNADGEAEEIIQINQHKLHQYNHGNTWELRQFLASHQNEADQTNVWNIDLRDDQGKRIEGRRGLEIGKAKMEEAREQLSKKTERRLRARQGGELSEAMKEKIAERVEQTNLKQRFEKK